MKCSVAMLAALLLVSAESAQVKVLSQTDEAARAVRALAAGCANCHGTQGVAQEGMDSLAGQKKDELVKKLMDFKTGRKPATLMPQLATGYSDEQIDQLAAHFAALKK